MQYDFLFEDVIYVSNQSQNKHVNHMSKPSTIYSDKLWLLLQIEMNFLLFAYIGYNYNLHIRFYLESTFRIIKYHEKLLQYCHIFDSARN